MNYENIFGEDWYKALKPFLDSKEFKNIIAELKKQKEEGYDIYPNFMDCFAFFRACPLSTICTGFILTSSNVRNNELILDCIYDGVKEDIGVKPVRQSIHFWNKQGVFLLHLNVTYHNQDERIHLMLWQPFIKYVINILSKQSIIFVLLGKDAKQYVNLINPLNNDFYFIEHPFNAILKQRPWKHKKIFSTINRITNFVHNKKIIWAAQD